MSPQLNFLADPSFAEKPMSDTGINVGHILGPLYDRNNEFRAALGNGRVGDITLADLGKGQGYMSTVSRCTVHFVDDSQTPYSFILKVPATKNVDAFVSYEMDAATKLAFVARAHNGECEFYETFKRVDDFPIPRVWFTRTMDVDTSALPGYIMMEDLSKRGTSLNISSSVTLEQIKNIARHLAALHSHILCRSLDSTPMQGFVYPVELDVDSMFKLGAKELVRIDAVAFESLLEKLEPVGSCSFNKHAFFERPKELGLPLLLCHGDLWIGNMLFEKASDGKASDRILAIIDWQTAFTGNPMLDLAQFICICADADVRSEAEHDGFIVKYYYAELARRLALAGKVTPFDTEQLTAAYKLALLTQASQFVVNVPFMTGTPLKDIVPEADYEAQLARIVSNGRRLLEDAVRLLDGVARPFLDARQCANKIRVADD